MTFSHLLQNEQRSQLPVRKAIVQQVLPSTKNPSKMGKLNLERGPGRQNGHDRREASRNDPLRLSVQSDEDDDIFGDDDAQLDSTIIERVKSPLEDTPRGQVAMTTQR
jgi:hypothetical protein